MINLVIRALGAGADRRSVSAVSWNIAGNCTAPYTTELMARPKTGDIWRPDKWFTFTGGKMTMHLDILTRCRKCDNCRKARSNEWRYRVREEVRSAGRTWFGTLTLTPSEQYRVLSAARHTAATRAIPWEQLTEEQRFRRVADASLKEVTKYIKRVRKEANVPFRYIVVTERHKSGLPHFHMLVHETELKPVRHATLSKQWHLGFEKWRLIPFDNLRAAEYVVKYISKSAETRIRASLGYGKEQAGIVGPLLASFNESQQG